MRVLVLGAGGPAGVNTCKALHVHEVVAADENRDHLVWAAPYAETVHLPELTPELVNEIGADFLIPQPDNLTLWAADHADEIEAEMFLSARQTIALCQDKFLSGIAWRSAGLREDRSVLIDSHPDFHRAELDARLDYPFWLRARHGAGAKAAVLARSWGEAYGWLTFWQEREPDLDFVAEEYLPGRDLAWSSIWYDGAPVASFLRERLEYIYPGLTPEGLTGTPTISEIVHDVEANEVATEAVLAVDKNPHGIYSVDLREDADGVPRPTEINAGRGFTTFGLWAMQADPNLFEVVIEAGTFGNVPFLPGIDCLPEGLRLYRHIDCGSFLFSPVPA